MIKFIIFLLAVYIGYKLLTNDFLKKRKKDDAELQKKTDEKIAAGDMVQDPECGTYVVVDGSITVRDGEHVYHFCSYECRDRFLERLADSGNAIQENQNQ